MNTNLPNHSYWFSLVEIYSFHPTPHCSTFQCPVQMEHPVSGWLNLSLYIQIHPFPVSIILNNLSTPFCEKQAQTCEMAVGCCFVHFSESLFTHRHKEHGRVTATLFWEVWTFKGARWASANRENDPSTIWAHEKSSVCYTEEARNLFGVRISPFLSLPGSCLWEPETRVKLCDVRATRHGAEAQSSSLCGLRPMLKLFRSAGSHADIKAARWRWMIVWIPLRSLWCFQ